MAPRAEVWDPSPGDPRVADLVGIGEDLRMTTYPDGQQHGTEAAPGLPSFPAPDPSSRVGGPPGPVAAPSAYAAPADDSPWAPPPAPAPTEYAAPQHAAVPAEAAHASTAEPASSVVPVVPAYGVSETLGLAEGSDPLETVPAADAPLPSEEPSASAAQPARRGTGRVVAVAVVVGLLAGMVGGFGAYAVAERRSQLTLTSPGTVLPQSDADLSARPDGSVAAVAAAVLPTVVQIEERNGTGGGTGSGFVLRSDGYILTNNHVVAEAANGGSLTVTFQDGTTKNATIVGRDASYDLAVIKVDVTGLDTVAPSATPTASSSATPPSRSARRSGSRARSPAASSARSTGRSRQADPARTPTSTRSRPTPRSTRATPVDRSSTRRAGSSASTRPSPRSVRPRRRSRAAPSVSASPSRSTRPSASPRRSSRPAGRATPSSGSRST